MRAFYFGMPIGDPFGVTSFPPSSIIIIMGKAWQNLANRMASAALSAIATEDIVAKIIYPILSQCMGDKIWLLGVGSRT